MNDRKSFPVQNADRQFLALNELFHQYGGSVGYGFLHGGEHILLPADDVDAHAGTLAGRLDDERQGEGRHHDAIGTVQNFRMRRRNSGFQKNFFGF